MGADLTSADNMIKQISTKIVFVKIQACVANDFTSDGRTYFGQNYAASP